LKVLHVVGTRPNFMKVAPVMRALGHVAGVRQVLVHTEQHYDRRMSDAFFEDLDMPEPDYFLGVGSGTHTQQTTGVMLALEPVLDAVSPDVVLVAGDVNSTLGGGLAAAQAHVPVAHLEAGLRSRDRTMPEEHNRTLTDHLSDLLLSPTREATDNLRAEGICAERIAFVGNTMIDSLRAYEQVARELDVAAELGLGDFVLVTLHRPGLVDRHDRFLPVMEALENIARSRSVIYPIHPRSKRQLDEAGWRPRRVRLLGPLGYLRFLSLMISASAVLTDSGGIQEETTVLGIPCITLRENTERPITVREGTNTVLGVGQAALDRLPELLDVRTPPRATHLEHWDGSAGARVREALLARYGT
jgi:UDP-N-acetylglucosamine 2-epimerase (non-hydrolysing)